MFVGGCEAGAAQVSEWKSQIDALESRYHVRGDILRTALEEKSVIVGNRPGMILKEVRSRSNKW
jgi:hypothetical protein